MDKEIDQELQRMVLENKYQKTLDFSEIKCSKCLNSLSRTCNLHSKNKINMFKEIMLKNNPEFDNKNKNKNILNISPTDSGEKKFTIVNYLDNKPESKSDYYQPKLNYSSPSKKNYLIDINGKKCSDISQMEFSFDDVFNS